MKKVFILALVIILFAACATNVPFRITKTPEGVTDQKRNQDDQECHTYSQVQGPMLFGLGYLMIQAKAASRYKECMTARGYLVEEM